MSETITFPYASKTSKLSASPTTKIPQSADWILQDFVDTMLDGDMPNKSSPSIQISELFPQENMSKNSLENCHSILANLYDTYNGSDRLSLPDLDSAKNSDDEEDDEDEIFQFYAELNDDQCMNNNEVSEEYLSMDDLTNPPILIESNISSVQDSSLASISDVEIPEAPYNTLNKRKSNSSFSTLRSNIMNAFHMNRKTKLQRNPLSLQNKEAVSPKNSVSLKLKKCLKLRF